MKSILSENFIENYVRIYLKQRFYRRNISLSEINPKNSKIFSILDYIFFNYNYKILLPQYTRIYLILQNYIYS